MIRKRYQIDPAKQALEWTKRLLLITFLALAYLIVTAFAPTSAVFAQQAEDEQPQETLAEKRARESREDPDRNNGREYTKRGTYGMPESRLKDILAIEGLRDNQLIGYGLVVGLNGTGDTLLNVPYTEQSLEAMLERLGVNIKGTRLLPENVAAVMVTATLKAFSRVGTRIDVNVSSIGDADDLLGGTLLVTPMVGADGQVYAAAQGPVAVAGFSANGTNASITQGVPTSGRVVNGAIVELEPNFELADLQSVQLSLFNPDFSTAKRVADKINEFLRANVPAGIELVTDMAVATDPATIQLTRQVGYPYTMVDILTQIEQLSVTPDMRARVLIDERTGLVVISADVRINPVAIAQGNLIISTSEEPEVSQAQPFAPGGQTETVTRTDLSVEETGTTELIVLPTSVTLQDLVDGLNALGVGPRDMISILQAIKTAGAMQAEIVIM